MPHIMLFQVILLSFDCLLWRIRLSLQVGATFGLRKDVLYAEIYGISMFAAYYFRFFSQEHK